MGRVGLLNDLCIRYTGTADWTPEWSCEVESTLTFETVQMRLTHWGMRNVKSFANVQQLTEVKHHSADSETGILKNADKTGFKTKTPTAPQEWVKCRDQISLYTTYSMWPTKYLYLLLINHLCYLLSPVLKSCHA